MMDLKRWVLLLACVSVAGAVLESLVSSAKGKRAFYTLCGVALLYAAVSPLAGTSLETLHTDAWLALPEAAETSLLAQRDDALLLAAKESCESAARQTLNEKGVTCSEVLAQCAWDDGDISLAALYVYGVPAARQTDAATALHTIFGADVKVYIFPKEPS